MVSDLQSHLQGYIDNIDTLEFTRTLNEVETLSDPDEDIENNPTNKKFDKEKQWFWVSVEIVKGLRGNREDTEALQFQIKQNIKGVKGGCKEKIWSTCLLLSVDAQEASFYSKNVAQLPLCLTCGDVVLNKQLFKGLQHKFDCTIFPLEIPEEELMWMSALWSGIHPLPIGKQSKDLVGAANNQNRYLYKMSSLIHHITFNKCE